jgi:hypothetical protein
VGLPNRAHTQVRPYGNALQRAADARRARGDGDGAKFSLSRGVPLSCARQNPIPTTPPIAAVDELTIVNAHAAGIDLGQSDLFLARSRAA